MTKHFGYYDDIDSTINSMLSSIEVWRTKQINVESNRIYTFATTPISIIRLQLNTIFHGMITTNELLSEFSYGQEEDLEKKLTTALSNHEGYKKLQFNQAPTMNKERQILRNAIAHVEFKIIEEENEWYINFNHPNLTGKVSIEELASIYSIIDRIRIEYETKQKNKATKAVSGLNNLLDIKVNNKQLLRQTISKIRFLEGDYPVVVERKLSKETEELIYSYIDYIGLNNWIEIPTLLKQELIEEILVKGFIIKSQFFPKTMEYLTTPVLNAMDMPNTNMSGLFYESPIAFAQSTLASSFFTFNYMLEAQKKEPIEDFHYFNLYVPCQIKYPKPEEVIKQIPTKDIVAEIDRQIEKEKKSLKRIIPTIKGLITLEPRGLNERQKHTLDQYTFQVSEIIETIEVYKNRKTALTARKPQVPNILYNSESFINHIRNSISHGFYTVDYLPGLKNKDLNKIVFHFEDYEIDKRTRSKRKSFDCKITAEALIKLIKLYSMKFSSKTMLDSRRPTLIYNNINQNKQDLLAKGDKLATQIVESRSNAFRI